MFYVPLRREIPLGQKQRELSMLTMLSMCTERFYQFKLPEAFMCGNQAFAVFLWDSPRSAIFLQIHDSPTHEAASCLCYNPLTPMFWYADDSTKAWCDCGFCRCHFHRSFCHSLSTFLFSLVYIPFISPSICPDL